MVAKNYLTKSKIKDFISSNRMVLAILTGVVLGFAIGFGLKTTSLVKNDGILWFTLPGKLFIRSLELLVLPVIFFAVVTATSLLDPKSNAKISLICIGLVFATHIIATVTGVCGSFIFQGSIGKPANSTNSILNSKTQKTFYDIVADILRALIPKNIIKATIYQELTKYVPESDKVSPNNTIYKRTIQTIDGTNLLGILVFAILIGLAASVVGEKAQAFRSFFESTNHVVTKVLHWLIMFAPFGIASLIIDAVIDINDIRESLKDVGIFAGAVIASLLLYALVLLSIFTFIFIRENPFKYLVYFAEPIFLGFASTSGAVCIHEEIKICETKLKMNPTIARFSLPFVTALQADGSGMFITMSTIFIAKINNYDLTAGDYVLIIILTSLLCLSLPSVPSSSIVTIIVVLGSVNLADANIGTLYTVEWLLDRVRTAVNVYSHCLCAVIVEKLEGKSRRVDSDDQAFKTVPVDEVVVESATSKTQLQIDDEAQCYL